MELRRPALGVYLVFLTISQLRSTHARTVPGNQDVTSIVYYT
jgi:hypothetical protein